MNITNRLKAIVKQILPPVITPAIQRAWEVLQSTKFRPVKEKQFPLSKGAGIVGQAKQHLEQATRASVKGRMPQSERWTAYLERIRSDISRLVTTRDVVSYAQSRIAFDHRAILLERNEDRLIELEHRPQTHVLQLQRDEDTLKREFPYFSNLIDEMGDSPYSLPETLRKYRGRLVSNVFFYHLRYVLQCLTYVKEPRIVCDIGGGYGGPARLWLLNPIHRPSVYVMVDFPESLFFAEVFLRVNFDELKLLYVTDSAPLDPNVVSRYSVILCPIRFVDAISSLGLDLVINTGSMQEMTEEWVDFWMEWLKKQTCRYFYSLNYFAQPLKFMAEGANTWSPRLTADWIVQFQTSQSPQWFRGGRNFAEILAEKPVNRPSFNEEKLLALYHGKRYKSNRLSIFTSHRRR